MARKTTKPPSRAGNEGFAIEVVSDANLNSDNSPSLSLRQDPVDVVVILAARANVALATARVHAELFGIGGAR